MMARLFRPHIPLKVRCQVAMRQHGGFTQDGAAVVLKDYKGRYGVLLHDLLQAIANGVECLISELQLDHDPPLGARQFFKNGRGEIVRYVPDANDPDHLRYRPHGPEHERSHLIKTNVRGDHGQHPDRVLIKKARRLERDPKPKRGPKIKSRGFTKPTDKLTGKAKWPKRKFESRREP